MMRTRAALARAAVQRARRVVGRLKRRSLRAVRTGAVSVRLLARRRRWRGIYLLASGEELAALPEPAIDRMREAVAAGVPVEVLVLDHAIEATPRRLPSGVDVRRFWEDAAPGHNAYAPGVERFDAATARPVPKPDGGWVRGRYRDGLPVVAVDTNAAGTRVEHYGPSGLPVRREELDERGRLVRIIDLDASNGAEVAQRYFDASGACWLSVGGGARGRALRHLPTPLEYPSFAAVQAEWASRRVATAVFPVVVPAGTASAAVEQQVRHLGVTGR